MFARGDWNHECGMWCPCYVGVELRGAASRRLAVLARNLSSAAALEYARQFGYEYGVDPTRWIPTDGPAPGWE